MKTTINRNHWVLLGLLFISACTQTPKISELKIHFSEEIKTTDLVYVKESSENGGLLTFADKTSEHILKISSHTISNSRDAADSIKRKFIQIQQLHEPQEVPYTGALTKSTTCASRNHLNFEIKSTDGSLEARLDLMASDQFLFGLCDEKIEKWKTQYLIFFCAHEKKLYEIKYFYPKEQPWLKKSIAGCSRN